MSRKKGTVVDLTSLQNMFEPLDIKMPPSTVDDKPKPKYRSRRYDEGFNSENKASEDNEHMTNSWRVTSNTRRETNDDNFDNIRKPISKDIDSELNDDSWSNLRTLSRDNTNDQWRDSSFQRKSYGSKKPDVDTRPERLRLKLLPKGAKAKTESESKPETISSRSVPTDRKDTVNVELNKKVSNIQTISVANSSDTQDDDSKSVSTLKSKTVSNMKQKELDEACKNEILSYNALFNCDSNRAKLVLDATIEVYENGTIDYNKLVDNIKNTTTQDNSNNCFETIVPSTVALCYVISKMSDSTTLEQSSEIMDKAKGWIKHLLDISNIENREILLLNQTAMICNYWNLPSLNTNLFLIEAVFDSLYCCGIISHSSFTKWFEDESSEIPDRITVMFQLLPWNNWFKGEMEPSESSSEENSQEEEDIDIEALVPKRIELNGRKPAYAY